MGTWWTHLPGSLVGAFGKLVGTIDVGSAELNLGAVGSVSSFVSN